MRRLLLLLITFSIVSCASKLDDLQPASREAHFVLNEDVTAIETRGLLNVKWLIGLQAGKYVLVGEDEQGSYYLAEPGNGGVMMLANADADKYLETGSYHAVHESNYRIPASPKRGGLWIPKPGSSEPRKIFHIVDTDGIDGDEAGRVLGANSANSAGVNSSAGGAVGSALTSFFLKMEDEGIGFWTLKMEPTFLNAIEVSPGL